MNMPQPCNEDGTLNVIIETPKGSSFKNDYDPALEMFRLVKTLPAGMHFPYDFGFIPGTLCEDGDPMDILVLAPYPLFVGCVANVKLVGVLEAEQTPKTGRKTIRNDRLLGCLQYEVNNENAVFSRLKDIPRQLLHEIEAFFIQYTKLEGKVFQPLGWFGPRRARELLQMSIRNSQT